MSVGNTFLLSSKMRTTWQRRCSCSLEEAPPCWYQRPAGAGPGTSVTSVLSEAATPQPGAQLLSGPPSGKGAGWVSPGRPTGPAEEARAQVDAGSPTAQIHHPDPSSPRVTPTASSVPAAPFLEALLTLVKICRAEGWRKTAISSSPSLGLPRCRLTTVAWAA